MAPTLSATLQVATDDLRAALTAVLPHAAKVKTGDDQGESRVRLTFTKDWLYVLASNSSAATTALAIVKIIADSRADELAPSDGPMIGDLQLRQAKLILQQFKAKPADPNGTQLVEFRIDLEEEWVELQDIGGLWSAGELVRYVLLEPAESFPDIIGITSLALATAGSSSVAKPLVTDAKLLAQFKAAGTAYKAPLQCDGIGEDTQRGFLITCGSRFLGTIESRHGDDDSLARRDSVRLAWLGRLPARKLRSA
jgi:hypothetical protein